MYITKNTVEEISKHALRTYPEECCGIVTGDRHDQMVHCCQNIQNILHREDPEKYPRDARTAYVIDRNEAEEIFSFAREQGKKVMAFYHSHVDHEAYFSKMDKEVQTVFGEPEFPEALQLVLSVKEGKIKDIKCFKWDREKKDFFCISAPHFNSHDQI